MRRVFLWLAVFAVLPALAAELKFDFSQVQPGQVPPGFQSIVAGTGHPGDWKVIMDDVPPALAPLTSKAPSVSKRPVLAQMDRYPDERHFPILLYEKETFGDFKLTTRFKLAGGAMDQTAGVVFRFEDASNYYVVHASGLGGTFQCDKVANGVIKPPIGPEVPVARDVWHDLSVQCEGTRIICSLDGKDLIKLVDSAGSGTVGKIGFWTQSDSVSYFTDAKITYKPREILAQTLVRNAMEEYSRLLGIEVFAIKPGANEPSVVASTNNHELGQPGGKAEADVIRHGTSYISRSHETATVTAPIRDRNGDPIAAVRITMKSFPGQTEENAVVRAQPVVKKMEQGVLSLHDLLN